MKQPREYELRLGQFPNVVITLEYDEAERKAPALQTTYNEPGEGNPACVIFCPGTIKRINVNGQIDNDILYGLFMVAGFDKVTQELPEPTFRPPKPTPEPYAQEKF